jgi:hypothetical protein
LVTSTFNETNEVEKSIHGVNREYNQINLEWDYASTLSSFRAPPPQCKEHTFLVRTKEELDIVLTQLNEDNGTRLRLICGRYWRNGLSKNVEMIGGVEKPKIEDIYMILRDGNSKCLVQSLEDHKTMWRFYIFIEYLSMTPI